MSIWECEKVLKRGSIYSRFVDNETVRSCLELAIGGEPKV